MPYIKQSDRIHYDQLIKKISAEVADRAHHDARSPVGDLNYIITSILLRTFEQLNSFPCYVDVNEMVGVLECAKLEFYRRHAAPYEDQKILENGDVEWKKTK